MTNRPTSKPKCGDKCSRRVQCQGKWQEWTDQSVCTVEIRGLVWLSVTDSTWWAADPWAKGDTSGEAEKYKISKSIQPTGRSLATMKIPQREVDVLQRGGGRAGPYMEQVSVFGWGAGARRSRNQGSTRGQPGKTHTILPTTRVRKKRDRKQFTVLTDHAAVSHE